VVTAGVETGAGVVSVAAGVEAVVVVVVVAAVVVVVVVCTGSGAATGGAILEAGGVEGCCGCGCCTVFTCGSTAGAGEDGVEVGPVSSCGWVTGSAASWGTVPVAGTGVT
jgi:hypothetical protein